MKHTILPAGLLAFALLTGGALSDERAQNADLEARVAELEGKHAELTAALEEVSAELGAMRATDRAVLAYLERQGSAARDMASVLDATEKKGFTAGINPDSRITLLSGLRAFYRTAGADLPKAQGPAGPTSGASTSGGTGR